MWGSGKRFELEKSPVAHALKALIDQCSWEIERPIKSPSRHPRPMPSGRVHGIERNLARPTPVMTEPEGYLIVETHTEHPELVRVLSMRELPVLPDGSPPDAGPSRIRYLAFFFALHVAHMHAQTALRKWMVDAEAGLYRIDPVTAVAAIESIDLKHRRIYLDPDLAAEKRLDEDVARRRRRLHRNRLIWNAVGILALLLLILFAQLPVF